MKKHATTTTTTTAARRPALGNLVNRTDRRILNDKKPIHTNSNENVNAAGSIDLKNVKARVDTHWKNEPLRKPLLRNNSVKKASLTSIGTIGSTNSGPKLVKTKAIETATVKEVKVVERPILIKRQDSTLTRPAKAVTNSGKTSIPIINKNQLIRTKSIDSAPDSAKLIADIPLVQSRFRPPSFTATYSNGLINDVSIYACHEHFDNNIFIETYRDSLIGFLFNILLVWWLKH